MRAVVARSTYRSKNGQSTSLSEFGSSVVEKVYGIVARSTFRSQHVTSTPFLDHFWKLSCSKSVRRCGGKHISKSKCLKTDGLGPLLAVEMSKKCTLFATTTATATTTTTLRYTTLRYTTLHYTTLRHTTLITLHDNYNKNYIALYATLHYISYSTVQYSTLQLQLRYTRPTTTNTTALRHSSCGRRDRCNNSKKTQLQLPFGPSVDSFCHLCITTTHLSGRFPILETSAAAFCGTRGKGWENNAFIDFPLSPYISHYIPIVTD